MSLTFNLLTVFAAFALKSVCAQDTSSSLASDLITVPVMTFPKGIGYFAGIRSTKDGVNFCAGTLIGPSHVLARTSCIVGNIRWVSLGSTFSQGNKDGEQIKVAVLLPHPNNTAFHNDYLILELAEETTFKPVRLDSAISMVKPGMKGSRLGWKDASAQAVESPHLQGAGVQFVSNELCATELTVDDTNLCSRGVSGVKSCLGDKGGAVIVKDKDHDVLVGYVSQTTGCGKTGGMSVYSRISAVRPWIDSIIKGYCVS